MDDLELKFKKHINSLENQFAENLYQTIQLLSTIIATTEIYYEGSHSRYVALKSSEVAQRLGMNELDCYEIEIAGLFHDIGKLTFKENLLAKYTAEMNAHEFKNYSAHPLIGKELLSKHNSFSSIADIVYQHHEKIDGSGFPNHLQGKEINPAAAIIAVVDTFHNLFYRTKKDKTLGTSSAVQIANTNTYLESTKSKYATTMNYLHQKSGILFDSKIVDTFIDIMELERKNLGVQSVMRIPLNKLEAGMVFAEDYYTSYGLLIAARNEKVKEDTVDVLIRFSENGEMPQKVLVIR